MHARTHPSTHTGVELEPLSPRNLEEGVSSVSGLSPALHTSFPLLPFLSLFFPPYFHLLLLLLLLQPSSLSLPFLILPSHLCCPPYLPFPAPPSFLPQTSLLSLSIPVFFLSSPFHPFPSSSSPLSLSVQASNSPGLVRSQLALLRNNKLHAKLNVHLFVLPAR